jgi:hypothetical protein
VRIAIVGGTDFVPEELEDFLYALNNKYPDAIIVTGNGQGAEKETQRLLEALGMTVEIPRLHTEFKHKETSFSPTDHQVGTIIEGDFLIYQDENGKTQHRFISHRADVIVIVGNPDSSRPRKAINIWKRMDSWRDKKNQRPLHRVAAPPVKKKAKVYKTTKKYTKA